MRPTTARSRILHRPLAMCLAISLTLPVAAAFHVLDLTVAPGEAAMAAWPARDIALAASFGLVRPGPSPWARLDVVLTCPGGSGHYRILPAVLRV